MGSPPSAPKPLGAGRWAPRASTLDALPGPAVCDDWEAAKQHPECKRVAGLVLDAANRRDAHPMIPKERNLAFPIVLELVKAGYIPEALADAVAAAPAKTLGCIMFELRQRAKPRSVGSDGVDVARRWVQGGSR